MNSIHWIGIIAWGVFVTGFGLSSVGAGVGGETTQPQDLMFLVAGGLVTCLIGMVGLVGVMGWVPGLRTEQKSYS